MSIFDLTIDLGLISALLLIGVFLRARFRFIQKFFIPASMIAGFIGLALGPNGFGWLPFSEAIADYPTILIAVIFGAIPIGAAQVNWKKTFQRVRNMWVYSMLLTLLMWGGGAMITLLVLMQIWDIPSGFGLILGAGFLGGHGTAAAIGEALGNMGWEQATALGYTSATIGLLCAIVGGLFIVKRYARKNQTNFISDFKDLPDDLRTGLVKTEDRESTGSGTVSPNTVDPLFFHLALIGVVVVISYYLQDTLQNLFPQVSVPLLSLAFIVGLFIQIFLRKSKANRYVDKTTINRISGTATDLTVAFGIASINLAVVASYIGPLIALFIFGVLWAYAIFHFISPRVFHQHWFENGIFGWGWSTGTVAMGIALLKVVDPKNEATTLDDYALGYIAMVPIEVLIITFGPLLLMTGLGFIYVLVLLGVAVMLLIIAAKAGWLVNEAQVTKRRKAS
ncbi:ESS family glutamate:Na+ symporter [Geomicrobium halophilum]|uniref:ESS family glutamate:Na+ symporter n=1 Tax=Geomicrobium halophilum TaxID=549000 RepID=A0A841Q1V6_9BACL|nr:sodium/glutamate symporter [Geomicrobium halophilum]MBB6450038.1 ESS family glutamate:Na+ symporter [Geomicrobium halophilum]